MEFSVEYSITKIFDSYSPSWFYGQETFIIINVENICDTFFRVL